MLVLLLLAPALTLPSVAHRPQLAGGRRVARHPQLQLLASSASPKEEITTTAGLSVGVACIGCVLFGYHLGVVNAPLDAISATLGFAGDAVRQGQVVSIGLAGAFLGSLGGGPLADGVGRKGSFAYTATTCAVGAALCASAQSFSALLLGRLICGLGIGAALCCVSLFIPEVAPPSQRGFLSSLNQLFTCGGILLSIVAGLPLARAGPAYWRKMFAVAILPCIAQLGALLWVPESPRWLAKAGRKAEAQEAATRLWGPGAAVPAVEASEAVGGSWAQLVSPRYRKLVAISSLLFVFQQFAGINAVVFFSTKVFANAGVGSAVVASILVAACNIGGTACAGQLLDRLGRKPLLVGSFLGMAATMLLMAAALALPALAPLAPVFSVVGTVLYISSFALGVGPIPAIMTGELLPAAVRANGAATAFGVHWLCNIVIGNYFLLASQRFGVPACYSLFGGVALAGAAFCASQVPETKGRSLEEIEAEYAPA